MVIETTTFRLTPGTDEAAFMAADGQVQQAFFYLQPGCMRRTTARGPDGEWLVVVLWDSPSDAEAAERNAATDPAALAFSAHVDAATVRTSRYTALD